MDNYTKFIEKKMYRAQNFLLDILSACTLKVVILINQLNMLKYV